MSKNLVSISDLSKEEIEEIFDLTVNLKEGAGHNLPLQGKTLAMIFEKPSLRTRVTFETGMQQLGGNAIYLSPSDIQLGKRESVKDVARNLTRWCNGIMARTFDHNTVEELSRYSTIPVINGLTKREHPCQALADIFTLYELMSPGVQELMSSKTHKLTDPQTHKLTLAYVGDGNNVCHSLLLLCGKLGLEMRVGCPAGYEPDPDIVKESQNGSPEIQIFHDPFETVKGCSAIYTDVWTSMGQEEETLTRKNDFKNFQVNSDLLAHAEKNAWVMHCLPANRGEEITDDVLDGIQSIVLDQAENRLHVQKALLIRLLAKDSKLA
jgi:ornithine carbamoyltransferase